MRVRIRDYVDADFPFVRSLFVTYLAEERDRVPLLGVADDFPDTYLPQLVRKTRAEEGLFLVAETEGANCGFLVALPKERAPWDQTTQRSVMIMEAHVDPRFRRRGVGRALFAEVEQRFLRRGFEWATLGTFAGNVAAHSFYRALGYEVTYQFMGKGLRDSQ